MRRESEGESEGESKVSEEREKESERDGERDACFTLSLHINVHASSKKNGFLVPLCDVELLGQRNTTQNS